MSPLPLLFEPHTSIPLLFVYFPSPKPVTRYFYVQVNSSASSFQSEASPNCPDTWCWSSPVPSSCQSQSFLVRRVEIGCMSFQYPPFHLRDLWFSIKEPVFAGQFVLCAWWPPRQTSVSEPKFTEIDLLRLLSSPDTSFQAPISANSFHGWASPFLYSQPTMSCFAKSALAPDTLRYNLISSYLWTWHQYARDMDLCFGCWEFFECLKCEYTISESFYRYF